MLKVALTGGIATGKSYVLARLRERGIRADVRSSGFARRQLWVFSLLPKRAEQVASGWGQAVSTDQRFILMHGCRRFCITGF